MKFIHPRQFISFPVPRVVFFVTFIAAAAAQEYTRGVGIYPGNVKKDFSLVMKIDSINYRNLTYQSSSYDFNLTARLVTDGIKESKLPGWMNMISKFYINFPK